MATSQDIANQYERLVIHRQNVQLLLQQIAAQGGWMHAPVGLLNTLAENCVQITRCKMTLRGWGVLVEDHPDDSVAKGIGSLEQQINELKASLQLPLSDPVHKRVVQSLQEVQERRSVLEPSSSAITGKESAAKLFGTALELFERLFNKKIDAQDKNTTSVNPILHTDQRQDNKLGLITNTTPYSLLNEWKRDAFVDHDILFGIDESLVSLGEQLVNPEANWIISIFGESGIGKTALAYELARRYYSESGFTRIAWVSAKPIHIDSIGKAIKEKDVAYFWNDLIIEIADRLHLDIQASPSTWELEFPRVMHNISSIERCLIIIDNLETIDDASETIKYLEKYKVIKPHKVIITTRKSVQLYSSQVKEHHITGLSQKDAQDFIRHLGKGDINISGSSDGDLDEILSITEGNPFLIKLVIRLFTVKRQPFSTVVADLKSKKADLGNQVNAYLYAQSIMELQNQVGKDSAIKILNVFCSRVPEESVSYDEFYHRSRIDDKKLFEQARQNACNLSLIRAIDKNRRFTIHSLLREYICSSS